MSIRGKANYNPPPGIFDDDLTGGSIDGFAGDGLLSNLGKAGKKALRVAAPALRRTASAAARAGIQHLAGGGSVKGVRRVLTNSAKAEALRQLGFR